MSNITKSKLHPNMDHFKLNNLPTNSQHQHSTTKLESCDICGLTFHNFSLLKHHLRSHERPHRCVDCYQTFRLLWQLKAHEKIHKVHRERRLPFSTRAAVIGMNKRLRLNESGDNKTNATTDSEYGSDLRHKSRSNSIDSDAESSSCDSLISALPDKENDPSSASCDNIASTKHHHNLQQKFSRRKICKKTFIGKLSLQQHLRNKTTLNFTGGKKQLSPEYHSSLRCDLCNKSFKFVAQMKRHLTSVHCSKSATSPSCKCKHCSAVFSSLNDLKAHLVNHRAEFSRTYPCKHCKKVFGQLSALTEHLKSHAYKPHVNNENPIQTHSSITDFHCNICPIAFTKLDLYRAHADTEHSRSHPVQCSTCHDRFHADCELKIHSAQHCVQLSPEEMILPREYAAPVKCNVCEETFKTKGFDSLFRLHMDQAHRETHPHYCATCFARFETKVEYKLHKKVHRSTRAVVDKQLWYIPGSSCNLCLKWNFSYRGSKGHYNEHMEKYHDDCRFKCEVCEDRFDKQSDLDEHMVDHNDDDDDDDISSDDEFDYPRRRFHCNVCNTYFLFGRMSYKFHSDRFHSGTHPFRCDVCYDRFENELLLKIHSQTHGVVLAEKEKSVPRVYAVPEFKCTICDHKFGEKGFDSEYRFHMDQLHVYSHPFRCEMCAERFKTSSELWWHEKYHVGKEPVYDPLLTHVLEYECNVCRKPGFIYRGPGSQYRKHQDETHEKTHPHQCDICFDSFESERDLKCHEFDTLHLRPFRCSLCPTWGFVSWGPDSPYKKHQDEFHASYAHQCERCHDRFEYQYELYEHIRDGHPDLRKRIVKSYWAALEEEKRKQPANATRTDASLAKAENRSASNNGNNSDPVADLQNKENFKPTRNESGSAFDEVDGEILSTGNVIKTNSLVESSGDRRKKRKGIPRRMDDCSLKTPTTANEIETDNLQTKTKKLLGGKEVTDEYADGIAETGQGLLDFIGNLVIDINAEKAMSTDDSVSSIEGLTQKLNQNNSTNGDPNNAIYTCNQCGRVFTRKASYSRHLKFHSGVRPYSCHFCERRFIQSSDLKRHIHTHTGEKTHLCVRCGDKFLHLTQLHRHRKKCTGELNLPLEPKAPRSLPMRNVFPESSASMGLAYIQSMMLKQKNLLPAPNLTSLPVIGVATPMRPMKLEMNNLPVFPGAEMMMSPVSPMSENGEASKSKHTPGEYTDDSDVSNMSAEIKKENTTRENESISSAIDVDQVDGLMMMESPNSMNSTKTENLSPQLNYASPPTTTMAATKAMSKNTCKICGRVFNCQNNLARHIRAHTGEKPHGCKYCGKRFIQSSDLKRHVGIHTGQMPFKCEICQQQFVHKHRYLQHMERHGIDADNVAAFSASPKLQENGDDSFGTASGAKDLIRMSILKKIVHRPDGTEISEATAKMAASSLDISSSDENVCATKENDVRRGKSFDGNDVVKDEVSKPDTEPEQGDGKKQTFECQYCGKNFKFHALLARHIPKHTGERAFKCSICNKGFIQTSDLKRHMLRHNGYTPHMCKLCFKEFVFEDRMFDHYRTAHKMAKNWIEEQMLKQKNHMYNNENIPEAASVGKKTMKLDVAAMPANKNPFPLSDKMNINYNGPVLPLTSRPDDWKFLSAQNPMVFNPNLVSYPTIAAQLRVSQMNNNGLNQDCPLDLSVNSLKMPKMKEIKNIQPLQPSMKENNALHIGKVKKGIESLGKKFKCDICGREFPLLTSLRRHMMSHSGERQVFCHLCGQGFLQVADLSKHMTTHLTQPLNIRCKECNAEFLTEQRLLQHIQIVHRPYQTQLQDLARDDNAIKKSFFTDDAGGRDMVDGAPAMQMNNGNKAMFNFQKTSTPFKLEMKSNLMSPTSSDESPVNEDESLMKDGGKPKKAPYKRPRGIYPCDYCGRVFPYKAALVRHVRVHTGERPFKCHECGHGFIQSSDLKRHLSKHADKNLKCMFCPLLCTTREDLETHAKLEHGFTLSPVDLNAEKMSPGNISAEIERKFKMNGAEQSTVGTAEVKCGRKSRKGIPKRHVAEEIEDVTTCAELDEDIDNNEDDSFAIDFSEKESHAGYDEPDGLVMVEPPKLVRQSPLCFDALPPLEKMDIDENHNSPHKVPLQMPVLQRMVLPQLSLQECDATTKNEKNNMSLLSKLPFATSDLENKSPGRPAAASTTAGQDVPKPNSEGLYQCTYCDKTFRWPCLLTRHVRKHTGEKPFPCTICSKTFLQSSDLKRHMYTHSGNKPFKCNVCNMEFVQRAKLLSHLKKHGQTDENSQMIANLMNTTLNGRLQCKFCKKKFRNEMTLSEHMADHKLYKCQHCNMTYLSLHDLQQHENSSHANSKALLVETPPILDVLRSRYPQSTTNTAVFPGPMVPSVDENSDVSYLCSNCDRFFDDKVAYDIHVMKCEA